MHLATTSTRENDELVALINLSYAKYYMKRNKPNAAHQYINRALRTYSNSNEWVFIAECYLHKSYILWKLGRQTHAMRQLYNIIELVKVDKFDITTNKGRAVLVIAIHNMAAQQFCMDRFGDACMSIENTSRLVQLCMSYGDRDISNNIETTHQLCIMKLTEIVFRIKDKLKDDWLDEIVKESYE